MEKYSNYWRPKRKARNFWLGVAVIFLVLFLLDLNNIVKAGIPFVSLQIGLILFLVSLIEDLRYRFYRKFEQAEDEAAQENEEIPMQR